MLKRTAEVLLKLADQLTILFVIPVIYVSLQTPSSCHESCQRRQSNTLNPELHKLVFSRSLKYIPNMTSTVGLKCKRSITQQKMECTLVSFISITNSYQLLRGLRLEMSVFPSSSKCSKSILQGFFTIVWARRSSKGVQQTRKPHVHRKNCWHD